MDPDTPAQPATDQSSGMIEIDLSTPPQMFVAATRVLLVDRGSNFVLVYLVESGRLGEGGTPLACQIILTPSALWHFAKQGEDVIARAPGMRQAPEPDRPLPPPKDWVLSLGSFGANFVSNSVSGDMVASDFYLVVPRQLHAATTQARQQREGTQDAKPLKVTPAPAVTCAIDLWSFRALVGEASKVASERVEKLGAKPFLIQGAS